VSPDVLRRKLQKKAKRKPYGKCPTCGRRTVRMILYEDDPSRSGLIRLGQYRLFRVCRPWSGGRCRWWKELFWTGRVVEQADT
jgi:hypothetical protein